MKRSQNGFTIIEVLFVLAIAGLILLLVFLALPQLQRNSRNSRRRNDVTAILESISHYELNHSGDFPECSQGSFPSCYGPGNLLEFAKLTYYTSSSPSQVIVQSLSAGASASHNPDSDAETVYVFNHQKCSTTNGTSTPNGAGFGDVVALFAIDSGSGTSSQCIEL